MTGETRGTDVEAQLTRIARALAEDARLPLDSLTRPHPLLVMLMRGDSVVLLAPAGLWDRGRELLKPFAARFAEGTAMLILVGAPKNFDVAQAVNKGLASVLGQEPSKDDLYVII